MNDMSPAYKMTRESVKLGDGYIVDFISVQNKSQQIDIGLDTDACVEPTSLKGFINAGQSRFMEDIHGRDVGGVYWSINNGIVAKF